MAQSWAVEFRPQTLEEMIGQGSVIKILEQQYKSGNVANCYLITGPSGVGKTTASRAFGYLINEGQGVPLEWDAASHNGVDDVRELIRTASERSVDSEYKVIILDECHMFSTAAWNAFLKCIEEPPKYTIFMFCTTNPEKIPATILNRVMRLNLSKISTAEICSRLKYICSQKGCTNYEEACDYIAKLSDGGCRDAIATLEKCASYSMDLSIENVLNCLGDFSYDSFFNLTIDFLNNDEGHILQTIESYYNNGFDLKQFVEHYLDFVLDIGKYCLFKDLSCTKIPSTLAARCDGFSKIPNAIGYANKLIDGFLNIKNMIKYDVSSRTTIEAMCVRLCGEMTND